MAKDLERLAVPRRFLCSDSGEVTLLLQKADLHLARGRYGQCPEDDPRQKPHRPNVRITPTCCRQSYVSFPVHPDVFKRVSFFQMTVYLFHSCHVHPLSNAKLGNVTTRLMIWYSLDVYGMCHSRGLFKDVGPSAYFPEALVLECHTTHQMRCSFNHVSPPAEVDAIFPPSKTRVRVTMAGLRFQAVESKFSTRSWIAFAKMASIS